MELKETFKNWAKVSKLFFGNGFLSIISNLWRFKGVSRIVDFIIQFSSPTSENNADRIVIGTTLYILR